jgi:hypothetical protein
MFIELEMINRAMTRFLLPRHGSWLPREGTAAVVELKNENTLSQHSATVFEQREPSG